jgi:hypothetical protein
MHPKLIIAAPIVKAVLTLSTDMKCIVRRSTALGHSLSGIDDTIFDYRYKKDSTKFLYQTGQPLY